MNPRRDSWSELPPELLLIIAGNLPTKPNVFRFRSVCQQWRKSAPFSLLSPKNHLSPLLPHILSTPEPPLLLEKSLRFFIPPFPFKDPPGRTLILVASSVILIRSTINPKLPPWLITVEEFNPGKLYLRKPLTRIAIKDLPKSFTEFFYLSDFQVLEIASFCHFRYLFDQEEGRMFEPIHGNRFVCNHKVVLFVDPKCRCSPTIDDCTAMVLHSNGTLSAVKLKDEFERQLESDTGTKKFDDIVKFKGMIYAVDRKGRVFRCGYNSHRMTCVTHVMICEGVGGGKRKYMVESCGELYLVHKCHKRDEKTKFEIYKLDEEAKRWVEVNGIGNDRVLFVTYDGCFSACSKDFPGWKGNCIIFYRGCFPTYSCASDPNFEFFMQIHLRGWRAELNIAIYHFEDGKGKHVGSYASYSSVFRPAPPWVSDTFLGKRTRSDEHGKPQADSVMQQSSPNCMEGTTNTDSRAKEHPSKDHIQNNLCVEEEMKDNTATVLDSTPTTTAKDSESGVSKVNFQGVDVKSDVIPTLSEIWAKYGNVLEGCTARSKELRTFALESLAKVVILLQSNTGRTLNDYQVSYLNVILRDLKMMRVRVNWLVPFVERASTIHKGVVDNQLKDSLEEIEKVKSQMEEMRTKFLVELSGLEERLNELRKIVSDKLSVSGLVDQDECLGEGLL